jgi:hypothetical protein
VADEPVQVPGERRRVRLRVVIPGPVHELMPVEGAVEDEAARAAHPQVEVAARDLSRLALVLDYHILVHRHPGAPEEP